jgi:hypothetical protein
MAERICQIGVDGVRRKVSDLPSQTLAQDTELLGVAGASAAAIGVSNCQVQHSHSCPSNGEATGSKEGAHGWSWLRNRYNQQQSTPSSIESVRSSESIPSFGQRLYPILRALWLALLVAGIFLHRSGDVLVLLVLGQFGDALKEALSPRTG